MKVTYSFQSIILLMYVFVCSRALQKNEPSMLAITSLS